MNYIYILISALILMRFFGAMHFYYPIYLINIFVLLIFVFKVWIKKDIKTPFDSGFKLLLVGLIASIISSCYYEYSNVWDVFSAYYYIISIFFFYFLCYTKTNPLQVEKALIILSIIMCILYIIEYIGYERGFSVIGNDAYNLAESGSDLRLRMDGSALAGFAYFYGLCRLLINKGLKSLNVALIALGLIVIILMAFRTMLVGIMSVSLILSIYLKGTKSSLVRSMIFGFIIIISLYNVPFIHDKIEYMIEKQQQGTQSFTNEDYVRWINLDYHLNDYTESSIEYFFGSGMNSNQKSNVFIKNEALRDSHLLWVDWGLLGLSWMIGIISVIGMIIYSVIVIIRKYNAEYYYIPSFFLYLVLISITTNEFARTGNFVVQSLVLYLAFCYMLPKDNLSNNTSKND